eukprot:TRINITY_DN23054_c0_g1_i1.p1 TRINITY_DN23054_c0_g1~~TRINITY_DN23054_c0_g1_i1.p1  ORF type:complete len:415 (-),score=60.96 TRINITY_DN23054_c0_g1_i1:260-1504(-)
MGNSNVCGCNPCSSDREHGKQVHPMAAMDEAIYGATFESDERACVAKPAVEETLQTRLYVCGGRGEEGVSQRSAERFDAAIGAWEVLPPMLQARGGKASAVVVGGCLYLCGGQDEANTALKSVERFSPKRGVWQRLPDMIHGRMGGATATIGRCIYVCGGASDNGSPTASAERFTLTWPSDDADVEGCWHVLSPMHRERAHPACSVMNGFLYLCGGESSQGLASSSAESYDPIALSWRTLTPMTERRTHAQSAAIKGYLFVVGGIDADEVPMRSVERYGVVSRVWEFMSPMEFPRHLAAKAVFEGRIYMFGGCSSNDAALHSAERFDVASGLWETLPPMTHARVGAGCAAVVASPSQEDPVAGGIYICGGHCGKGSSGDDEILDLVERLDLTTLRWDSMPRMSERRVLGVVEAF